MKHNIEAYFFQSKPNHSDFEKIVDWIEMEELHIHIDKNFPLSSQGITEAYIYSKEQSKKGSSKVMTNRGTGDICVKMSHIMDNISTMWPFKLLM